MSSTQQLVTKAPHTNMLLSSEGLCIPLAQKGKIIDETSCGGAVFKRTPDGIRIGFIRNSHHHLAFAKGHVVPGETLEEAALRETREEMGLSHLRLMASLGHIVILFQERYREELRGKWIRKRIYFFLMETTADAVGCPERARGIDEVIWVKSTDALRTVRYANLRPVISAALEWLAYNCD